MNDPQFPPTGSTTLTQVLFSQADFDLFARLSGDDNPIHVDPLFAAGTRFGKTVAHGMLLFAAIHAALNRWTGGPLTLFEQHLIFPAPTFADEEVALHLSVPPFDHPGRHRVDVSLRGSSDETCRGHSVVGHAEVTPSIEPSPTPVSGANEFKGMKIGMRFDRIRVFDTQDVRALTELVDDPHPAYQSGHPQVPPPLLGGMISDLLGVSLPGPGANWLKQTYRFHRPVSVGDEMRASVEVTRLRPDKELVNLRTVCETSAGPALTGEALVLAKDVA